MPSHDPKNMTNAPDTGTGTLGKAMALVDIVVSSDRPLRFTDILEIAGQPRGTLHRQLSHLVEEGLLSLRADLTYEPGLRLLKFAARAWAGNEFRAIAAPHLRKLHEETGETVHLGVLRGSEVVYLDKVESRQTVRMQSQIGNASPVYCTGLGKAALSALSPVALREVVSQLVFRTFTDNTHRDAVSLMRDLDEARRLGYAFDREEHEAEIRCVAAAIRAEGLSFTGGISVTGPAYRVTMEQLEGWAPSVRRIAAVISEEAALKLGPGR